MKKLLIGAVLLAALLSGCGEGNSETTSDKYPAGYDVVAVQLVDGYYIHELKHKQTGCHFSMSSGSGSSFEQMFIEKDGQSIPYCD